MKKLLFLCLLMLLPLVASKASVEINGIYYNLNSNDKTAEVSYGGGSYSGSISIPQSDWAGLFEVASISNFKYYDDNGDGTVDRQGLEASIVESGSLQANYPYLIRAKDRKGATLEVSVPSTYSQRITVASIEHPNVRYKFTGNYSRLTGLNSARRYRLQGGALSVPTNDDEVLPPYRWYLTIDDLGNQLEPAAARSLDVRIVGEEDYTQGIDNLQTDDSVRSQAENGSCYDLQGRKVHDGRMRKGLYIINNKKHVVR